jgi:2-isopropylmalate synthase
MESVSGAKNVIFHVYLGIARVFRDVVLRKSPAEVIELAVRHTALVRDLTNEYSARHGTNFRLNFGVEGFSQAEPEYVVELCEEVKRTWGKAGKGDDRLSFNLAASVEIAPPNHFADQVRDI